ncbi:MAG TPA: DUF1192 domain-containing protein [Caulobacteraceae bacterium]
MDEPVEVRRARGWAVNELRKEDLDLYGRDELEERIELLQAEIARVRGQLDRKRSGWEAADALFSLGG